MLEKYRLNFTINEQQSGNDINEYRESIMQFQNYLKMAIGVMEMQKKQLKMMT